MTEYELAYLVGEATINMQQVVMNSLSIVSAYLIVAVLFSHRLSKLLAAGITVLFVASMILQVIAMHNHAQAIYGLAIEIMDSVAKGGTLGWHPSAKTNPGVLYIQQFAVSLAFVLFSAGAIYFFYKMRKLNLQKNTPAE